MILISLDIHFDIFSPTLVLFFRFKEKALKDAIVVEKYAKAKLKALGGDESTVSSAAVRQFCKNAHNVRVLRTRSLEDEYSPKTAATDTFGTYTLD